MLLKNSDSKKFIQSEKQQQQWAVGCVEKWKENENTETWAEIMFFYPMELQFSNEEVLQGLGLKQ